MSTNGSMFHGRTDADSDRDDASIATASARPDATANTPLEARVKPMPAVSRGTLEDVDAYAEEFAAEGGRVTVRLLLDDGSAIDRGVWNASSFDLTRVVATAPRGTYQFLFRRPKGKTYCRAIQLDYEPTQAAQVVHPAMSLAQPTQSPPTASPTPQTPAYSPHGAFASPTSPAAVPPGYALVNTPAGLALLPMSALTPPASPSPAPASSSETMQVLAAMVTSQSQTNAMLMKTLLERQIQPAEPAKVRELDAMLGIVDKLDRARSRGGDDDSAGMGALLGAAVQAFLTAKPPTASAPIQPPPTKPAPPRARARQSTYPIHPNEGGRPPLGATAPPECGIPQGPAVVTSPPPGRPVPIQAGQASDEPPTPAPHRGVAPALAAIADAFRKEPAAKRVCRVLASADTSDDVTELAEMIFSQLSDEYAEALRISEQGTYAMLLCAAFPELEPRAEFIAAIESALRTLIDEDREEGPDSSCNLDSELRTLSDEDREEREQDHA